MAWISRQGALDLLAHPDGLGGWGLAALKNHPDEEVARLASALWDRRKEENESLQKQAIALEPEKLTIPGVWFVEYQPETANDPPPSWFVRMTDEQAAETEKILSKHMNDYEPWVGPVVAIPFEQFKREVLDDILENAEEEDA